MRKLTLQLDDLAVQSFATHTLRGRRGTAHAHLDTVLQPDDGGDAGGATEPGGDCFTCELSCGRNC
ncbi:hypothetical protein [Longimicrobium sp.]|uniref:hypothetical protein n=1 Tax=Longimicrobium sp. TaxID=2029185 RepID=UPI002E349A0F|nr:hypothetical protein [Longimicrobium sp.]HEX6039870.1 hypothetical protein [Longimicrobium sp.]